MTDLPQLVTFNSEKLTSRPRFQGFLSFGNQMEQLVKSQRDAVDPGKIRQRAKAEKAEVDIPLMDGSSFVTNTEVGSFAEKVFNSLVELKVSVAQYAMHLDPPVRSKIFSDLDDVLNVEDWHEDDLLPRMLSFRDFLRWTIYSRRFDWLSLGFSDDGSLLVAWQSEKALLTARYDGAGRVWWTATVKASEEGAEQNHVAGDSDLEHFETEARRLD